MTKEIEKKASKFPFDSQDGKGLDAEIIVKFFHPLSNWTWYATGPVHGIQISRGSYKDRLIIPCDHIESQTKKYFSHIL